MNPAKYKCWDGKGSKAEHVWSPFWVGSVGKLERGLGATVKCFHCPRVGRSGWEGDEGLERLDMSLGGNCSLMYGLHFFWTTGTFICFILTQTDYLTVCKGQQTQHTCRLS